jgi:hypothetical protein
VNKSKKSLSGIITFIRILYSRRNYISSYVLSGLIQIMIRLLQMIVVIKICGLDEWKLQTLGILTGGLFGTLIDRGFSVGSNGVIGKLNYSELKLFFRNSLLLRFKCYLVFLCIAPFVSLLLFGRLDFLFLAFSCSQSFLSLASDWLLIAIDDRRVYMRYITLPKVLFSLVFITSVFILESSIPLVFISFAIVFWGNYKINTFLQKRSLGISNHKISSEELQLGRVTLSKVLGDIYWLAPGLIFQLLSPDYLIYILLWDRITKFFLAPSTSVSQSLTGYLSKTELTVRQRTRLTLSFHLFLASIFSVSGIYLISTFYPIFSERIFLSDASLILTACFIFLVNLNRGFILHVFYMSGDAVSVLLGNLFLLICLVLLTFPKQSLTFEESILVLVFPQMLVFFFYTIRIRYLVS